MNELKFYWAC